MGDQEQRDVGFISKVVPIFSSILGTVRHRELQAVPEDDMAVMAAEQAPDDMPESLEGTLFFRKGGRSSISSWKRRYVVLDLNDGGSLYCYRFTSKKHYPTRMLRKMYTKLYRGDSSMGNREEEDSHKTLCLNIPSHVDWVVRDIENDPASFVVEIPVASYHNGSSLVADLHDDLDDQTDADEISFASPMTDSMVGDHHSVGSSWTNDGEVHGLPDSLEKDLASVKNKNKPLRFYFNCPRKGNEKALWLRAFSEMERLSANSRKERKLFGSLKHMARVSRIRTSTSADFSRESLQLESDYRQRMPPGMISTRHLDTHTQVEDLISSDAHRHGKAKEYRVQPSYAYPHRWMTHEELRDEMILPSAQFQDLRLPSRTGSEIGALRVEVLQCLGLPKLDKASEANAVAYCVCGSYAFATDVIPDCLNPMWLCKMRRACTIPLFHAYARLYVGVFDEDNKRDKDDFVGRVVLDVSRLRPGCTYDVTLPLRLSSHVYSRRQRGAIRLRFHLQWSSERQALLSYLPKRVRLPRRNRPREHVTVECSSPKAFRNVAITVHGTHLPGKFSTNQLRAAIKEFNYTRILVLRLLRQTVKNTIVWKTPSISMFVFFAWMHCIYKNEFSLVPAYLLSFLLLHLTRNYAKYGINGPHRHFQPPTWEEMFLALIEGSADRSTQCIAPMDMYLQQPSLSGVPSPMSEYSQDTMVVSTHEPRGKGTFRALGFIEDDSCSDYMMNGDDPLEFPFSSGVDYPRLTIKESLATRSTSSRKSKGRLEDKGSRDNSVAADTNEERWSETSTRGDDFGRSSSGSAEEEDDDDDELGLTSDASGLTSEPKPRGSFTSTELTSTGVSDTFDIASYDASEANVPVRRFDEVQPTRPMPEQDIDVRVQDREGDNKVTLTEDLQDIKEKVHELTFNLFNDKAYVTEDPDAQVWGKPWRSEKKKGDYNAKKDLDKLLNVGQYSHSNPVIARIGLYIEPIVSASMSALCAFRALFNLFTWQDPFLSFWVSLGCAIVIVILFVFPWRWFMFFVGIISVGPQNLILRIYRERRNTGEPRRKVPSNSSSEKEMNEQPVFHGHIQANETMEDRTNGTHHVVVPYTPLMYQRFYDWPPEPQYARVKADRTSRSVVPANQRRRSTTPLSRGLSPPRDHSLSKSLPATVATTPPRRRMLNKRGKSLPMGKKQVSNGDFVNSAKGYSRDGFADNNFAISPEIQQAWLNGKELKKEN